MAIAAEHDSFESSSDAFRTLNPGLLRWHSQKRKVEVADDGVRIFSSFQGGYRALIENLQYKCSGKTKANGKDGYLGPHSSLSELCHTFHSINVRTVSEFLRDALDDKAINERTPLAFFIEEQNG